MPIKPDAIFACDAPARLKPSNYPEPYASFVADRIKQPLGDIFGLSNFGVNLTRLLPNSISALHHRHSMQDEFIYVLEGRPTLITDAGERQLEVGMVAGFPANGTAHHLENRTSHDCIILEIGDRTTGDQVSYPSDDLQAVMRDDGSWKFTHKNGKDY
ncbi:cupin domain-containing protein [Pseudochrobactrum sp. sp1633]|nr:cupin domain-containing protein [Pseudochrobactrum sp. sp1633]